MGRTTFQQLIQQHPGDAAYQIGLADACVMQFEASRTDPAPDVAALKMAESHALHACHSRRAGPEASDGAGRVGDSERPADSGGPGIRCAGVGRPGVRAGGASIACR